MASSTQTRTIRFKATDLRDIERFLEQNPIFDFSSLARLAIRRFIENPSVEVRGLEPKKSLGAGIKSKRNKEVEI